MSRTDHHRRPRPARKGNPARLLGVDDQAAARKGILRTAERLDDGNPQYASAGHVWASKPGRRKANQKAAHRSDRRAVREAFATTAYRRDPAARTALRLERAVPAVQRRRVDWDMS
ncbi:hypothetical protein [Streptomyces sp. NBC_01601]|uniref:hypothetical protein n=1 Tax=Streptomyces sp. NBC_01601 TaxID=2975892 RepID=UPI002E2C0BDF|nr:hypothetical protein [Streptomyces sp. NBC_01601]